MSTESRLAALQRQIAARRTRRQQLNNSNTLHRAHSESDLEEAVHLAQKYQALPQAPVNNVASSEDSDDAYLRRYATGGRHERAPGMIV